MHAIQQLGGKAGRGRKVKIPARPYLVFRPEDPAKNREEDGAVHRDERDRGHGMKFAPDQVVQEYLDGAERRENGGRVDGRAANRGAWRTRTWTTTATSLRRPIPPAVLVAWGDWQFGPADDNQNVRYASEQQIAVLVGRAQPAQLGRRTDGRADS
jgi:hypothetical protein